MKKYVIDWLLQEISDKSTILWNLSFILSMFGELEEEESKHWEKNVRSVVLLSQDTVRNVAEILDEIHAEISRQVELSGNQKIE